jgi:GTPase SAR1 family protein
MDQKQTSNTRDTFFTKRAKTPLSESKRDDIKKEIYVHNAFEFVETETRNCLLVGRTRSGKTTAMGILKDPCYSPNSTSIFSETQNPKFQSFSINNRAEVVVQKFTINIIDTPGLFEVKDKFSVDTERTNEVIAQTIAKCLENEITNIHCIIMFLTFEAGINRDDIEAMKLFLDMFGGAGVSVALCVTHADKHSDEWRENIRDQLLKHKELSELIDKEKMSILFMGCVDLKDKQYYDEETLMDDYISVYNMRKEMLEFIFAAKEKKMLNQMNVAKKKIEAVSAAMDTLIENYRFFLVTSDFQTSLVQERIIDHKRTINFLSENSVYVNVPELANKFVTLLEIAKKFKAKDMDNKLKLSLLWPLKLREDQEV